MRSDTNHPKGDRYPTEKSFCIKIKNGSDDRACLKIYLNTLLYIIDTGGKKMKYYIGVDLGNICSKNFC